MKNAISNLLLSLIVLLSTTAFATTRNEECLNEAGMTAEQILATVNESLNHLKTAQAPFALWEAINAQPIDVAAAKKAITEQNLTIGSAAASLLTVVAFHQCLALGPVAKFAGTLPLALESWFDLQFFDKVREARLQLKFRAPDPAQEQEAVKRLTPIAGQLRASGFSQMCRDPRTDAFFSRCLMIQFKTDADLAKAQPLIGSIARDYKNVVLSAIGVIRAQ
jgi:hypothetical protein